MDGIENMCKNLIKNCEYDVCEKLLEKEMANNPHSPIPHNLMGILLEEKNNHSLAMKHFRAAYSLDPSYRPASYNLELYGDLFFKGIGAFSELECKDNKKINYKVIFNENKVGKIFKI